MKFEILDFIASLHYYCFSYWGLVFVVQVIRHFGHAVPLLHRQNLRKKRKKERRRNPKKRSRRRIASRRMNMVCRSDSSATEERRSIQLFSKETKEQLETTQIGIHRKVSRRIACISVHNMNGKASIYSG